MVSKREVEARLHESRCDLHCKDHPYWTVSSSYNEALYFLRSRLIHSIRLQLEAKTCPCDWNFELVMYEYFYLRSRKRIYEQVRVYDHASNI